jgi:hypothetical protein
MSTLFVVDLDDHLGLPTSSAQLPVDLNHGHLDQISSGALDGRVDGRALGKGHHGAPVAVQLGQISPAVKQCSHVPPLLSLPDGALYVFLDSGIELKVVLDEPTSLLSGDLQLPG